MKLNPCPCGQTPTKLDIIGENQAKWSYVSGNCCGEWSIEFRANYMRMHDLKLIKLAVQAWNDAPRAAALQTQF